MKIIRFNRRAYAREFRDLHGGYERFALSIFQSALQVEFKKVADQLRRNENTLMFGVTLDRATLGKAYLKVYDYVGVEHAEFTYKWIQKTAGKKTLTFYSDQWRRAMAIYYATYGALRVAEVEKTTIEDIQKLLVQAALENMTQSETATFIADALDNPAYVRMRAMRIARTESTTAANYGSQLAAQDSEYQCAKVWIPVVDKRTRKSHRDMANKEPISLYENFNVEITKGSHGKEYVIGMDLMQYPGDPNASVGNIVNCRCTHAVVPLADANGLPILKRAA